LEGFKGAIVHPLAPPALMYMLEKLSEIVGTDSRDKAVGRSENLGGASRNRRSFNLTGFASITDKT